MYSRKCSDCSKYMLIRENSWKCNDCEPNPIRGTCGRCKKNILYSEDYAQDSPCEEGLFNYVCKECWVVNPQYEIFVFEQDQGWHYIYVLPEKYAETKQHYREIALKIYRNKTASQGNPPGTPSDLILN